MIDALQFGFMQNAIAAGFFTAIICGMLGALIVVNRISFISGGIAHSAYGGIGIAIYWKLPFLLTTLSFSVGAALIIGVIALHQKHRADSIIGVLWAAGMSLGIILADLTPGYRGELVSYLFGSILTVSGTEIIAMITLSILILMGVTFFYHELLALSYDEEFAKVKGVKTHLFYIGLLVFLALSVVSVVRVVGMILIIALLTIPPLTVEPYVKSLKGMMIGAVLLNIVFTIVGLWCSYAMDLASGASIVLIATLFYGLSTLFLWLKGKLTTLP